MQLVYEAERERERERSNRQMRGTFTQYGSMLCILMVTYYFITIKE